MERKDVIAESVQLANQNARSQGIERSVDQRLRKTVDGAAASYDRPIRMKQMRSVNSLRNKGRNARLDRKHFKNISDLGMAFGRVLHYVFW